MTIHVKTGTYTGNGSNVSVLIGFVPQAIEACNESEIGKWKAGMSSGAAMLVRGATGSFLRIETLGFHTTDQATDPDGHGFVAGGSMSRSGNTYYYTALGE